MNVTSPIPKKKARIEIIPLIDIMFFLLASFMMVSLSQVHMKGIKVNLPTGQSGETQAKRDYISVSVDSNGHAYFDKEEMKDYDQLTTILKKVHDENPEAKVF
ncbi:MAG TPA: biopolymer transporter ExbD, partial [Chthoniobacterales bacterium]|nr:biopolymer transporter ExbD [Chthoniobacterales bacterium]